MAQIDDFTLSYSLLRRYVLFVFKRFYSKFIILGKENIPSKGPVIFASNHLGALMDALIFLAIVPHNLPIVFIARSDIFKGSFASKALRFLKIMPAFRIRDGFQNVEKNNETFEQSVQILKNKNAIGIMPEGNQGEQRNIRPLGKGIFRIAFSAQEEIKDEHVKIVPLGIDYGSIHKFKKHLIVNVGKAIDVSEFMENYHENQASTTNSIKDSLHNALDNLTVNLDTKENYESFEIATSILTPPKIKELGLKDNTLNRYFAQQQIAKTLTRLEKEKPDVIKQIVALCIQFDNLSKKIKLPLDTLIDKPLSLFTLLLQAIILIATLPLFICGFILNVIPFFIPVLVRKKLKIKYKGFYSSFHFVLGALFTFPIFYIINTILYLCLIPAPWWTVFLFFILQYLLGEMAYTWYNNSKDFINQVKYKFLRLKNKKIVFKINSLKDQIIKDFVFKQSF